VWVWVWAAATCGVCHVLHGGREAARQLKSPTRGGGGGGGLIANAPIHLVRSPCYLRVAAVLRPHHRVRAKRITPKARTLTLTPAVAPTPRSPAAWALGAGG
jgi:hypothetical protein